MPYTWALGLYSQLRLKNFCRDITDKQRRLAEITEMIHTASLVHDDVVDDCDTRRGTSLNACLASVTLADF